MRSFAEESCCACGACVNSCPKEALSWEYNEKGFRLPKLDALKCVKCGKCVSVCPIEKPVASNGYTKGVYAAINKNEGQLLKSASGGVFSALATRVISAGGCAFGCGYSEDMQPQIMMIESVEEIEKLQGSKYVQAYIGDSYEQARTALESGREVLFSATPCYCAGLKKYLGKEYDKLICCELVCHGVPSEKVFDDYVNLLEKKLGGKITDLNFRDKKRGWGSFIKISYTKGKKGKIKYLSSGESYYLSYFKETLCCRNICYECKYAKADRCSDLAIGDYWGIKNAHPEIDTTNGVSVIITGSEKGEKFLKESADYLDIIESELKYATKENGNIIASSKKGNGADAFWDMYLKYGSEYVERDYKIKHKKAIIKGKVNRFVPRALKRIIKKVI